jgi:hypothetical protein
MTFEVRPLISIWTVTVHGDDFKPAQWRADIECGLNTKSTGGGAGTLTEHRKVLARQQFR